jgi:hypothetical protein
MCLPHHLFPSQVKARQARLAVDEQTRELQEAARRGRNDRETAAQGMQAELRKNLGKLHYDIMVCERKLQSERATARAVR